ncbi:hypothetical protein SAMN05421788_104300 [Filimonas lacunae]|uniref:Uncharacterized protein n=2 Tax=Filimonas lacunae TaxID=477680 RepID=A0A173MSE2_9BACT|nr:hypothetical protein FLA_6390 [Filimonas lacunae]SIT16997.1 hypothetical protein SAMN05421788_104300 [Filimonas lacunae]
MSNTKASKKEVRTLIIQRIELAFSDLKVTLGDKKFSNRAKKAAKILTEGFKATTTEAIVEKQAKKAKKVKTTVSKKKKTKAAKTKTPQAKPAVAATPAAE